MKVTICNLRLPSDAPLLQGFLKVILQRHLADLALQLGDPLPFAATDLSLWLTVLLREKLLPRARHSPRHLSVDGSSEAEEWACFGAQSRPRRK
jgi:hypothetical protein